MRIVDNDAVIVADMNELYPALYTDVSKRLAHFFDRHAHFAQKCDGSQDVVDAEKAGHVLYLRGKKSLPVEGHHRRRFPLSGDRKGI